MNMKKTGLILLVMLLALTGCESKGGSEHQAVIKLTQTELPVKAWQMDNSHMTTIHGQVLMDNQPVAYADVAISTMKTVNTDPNGNFSALIDQSQPLQIPVHIQSLDKATVGGKEMDKGMKTSLEKTAAEMQIAYPIEIKRVSQAPGHPDQVEVHAQAQLETKTYFPALIFDRYGWYGIIMDSSGAPVQDAVVELLDGEGESLTSSEPSGEQGDYLIEAIPKNVEAVSLLVKTNGRSCNLEKGAFITIPHQTSLEVDISLPEEKDGKKEGNISSGMLRMKLLAGAVYQGIMIGVQSGEPLEYTSTVPSRDGSFILTMPKKVWEKNPYLYETKIRLFKSSPVRPGDIISSESIPPARMYEPVHIRAQQKSSS